MYQYCVSVRTCDIHCTTTFRRVVRRRGERRCLRGRRRRPARVRGALREVVRGWTSGLGNRVRHRRHPRGLHQDLGVQIIY